MLQARLALPFESLKHIYKSVEIYLALITP